MDSIIIIVGDDIFFFIQLHVKIPLVDSFYCLLDLFSGLFSAFLSFYLHHYVQLVTLSILLYFFSYTENFSKLYMEYRLKIRNHKKINIWWYKVWNQVIKLYFDWEKNNRNGTLILTPLSEIRFDVRIDFQKVCQTKFYRLRVEWWSYDEKSFHSS